MDGAASFDMKAEAPSPNASAAMPVSDSSNYRHDADGGGEEQCIVVVSQLRLSRHGSCAIESQLAPGPGIATHVVPSQVA